MNGFGTKVKLCLRASQTSAAGPQRGKEFLHDLGKAWHPGSHIVHTLSERQPVFSEIIVNLFSEVPPARNVL